MSKSYGSIKRFSEHSLQNSSTNNKSTHKCYFHQSNNIAYFCTNLKCTLPLCQRCLPIHKKQHTNQKHQLGQQNILPFNQAYHHALQTLNSIISKKTNQSQIIWQKMLKLKNQFTKSIEQCFESIKARIFNDSQSHKLIEEKYNKIKKGSLKTLIFYYSQPQITNQNRSNKYKQVQSFSFDKVSQFISSLSKQLDNAFGIKKQIKSAFLDTDLKKKSIFNNQESSSSKQFKTQEMYKTSKSISQVRKIQQRNQSQFTSQKQYSLNQQDSKKDLIKNTNNDKNFNLSQMSLIQVLKDQKQRLNKVKNKNYLLASNYSSATYYQQSKQASRSMENFYKIETKKQKSPQNQIQNTNNQQQTTFNKKSFNQDRPLQIKLNRSNTLNQKKQNKFNNCFKQKQDKFNNCFKQKQDKYSTSLTQLQKIKRKYIGDYQSLSKQKSSSKSSNPKFDKFGNKLDRYNKKVEEYNSKLFQYQKKEGQKIDTSNQKYQNRQKQAFHKVLSRQQIRLNIENKMNAKYNNKYLGNSQLMKKTEQNNQLSNRNNNPVKNTEAQFTLNKNYQTETNRNNSQKDKFLMSSLRKQLRIQQNPGIQISYQQRQKIKQKQQLMKYTIQNKQNKAAVDKQNERYSKNRENQIKIIPNVLRSKNNKENNQKSQKNSIQNVQTDQLPTNQAQEGPNKQNKKTKIFSSQIQFGCRKSPYEGVRQKIKISNPSILKNQINQVKEKKQQNSKQLSHDSIINQNSINQCKRFNYLIQKGQ